MEKIPLKVVRQTYEAFLIGRTRDAWKRQKEWAIEFIAVWRDDERRNGHALPPWI